MSFDLLSFYEGLSVMAFIGLLSSTFIETDSFYFVFVIGVLLAGFLILIGVVSYEHKKYSP